MASELALRDKRVLVVEDEMLVSLMIEDVLADEGCIVVGPYSRFATALEAAKVEQIDAAVLDMNLAGVLAFPVAETLAERGIPFLFLSGYGSAALPAAHTDWPVCRKPFLGGELIQKLAEVCIASWRG